MNRYIDVEKLVDKIDKKWKELADRNVKVGGGKWDAEISTYLSVLRLIDTLQLQQEQPKSRLIQVKCIHPYDESWEKDKIYTCEVWYHGDLNRNFWDVYYDYGKDPKYVQFSIIELLNEEFAIVKQERPDVDLEEKIQDWCKENVTGVKPIYTADSLIYDLLPKTARHFYELGLNAKKEK